jgi:hypothetical protein
MFVGQPGDVIGPNGELIRGGQNVTLAEKNALNPGYLEELAFMEELIEIVVHESADENAENPVRVGNNGIFVEFPRGMNVVAKRKYVDCLIVKQTRVTTPEYINPAGERARAIKQHSAMKYPFSVIEDRNPKGVEWLRRRMADII